MSREGSIVQTLLAVGILSHMEIQASIMSKVGESHYCYDSNTAPLKYYSSGRVSLLLSKVL